MCGLLNSGNSDDLSSDAPRDVVSRPWSWSRGASRTWKMVVVLVLVLKKKSYLHLWMLLLKDFSC